MAMRWVGAALVGALVGLGGGYLAGDLLRAEPTTVAAASPVLAHDPSVPVDPERDYARDIDYPALEAGLSYRRRTLGDPPYRWTYRVPRGWAAEVEGLDEVRWRPVGGPPSGGFSVRVKLTTEHKSKADMVTQKVTALQALYDDVEILGQTEDQLRFSYRDPVNNVKRFNSFRWFSVPGESEAKLEMSVVGREVDRAGLADLFDQVARGVASLD